MIVRPGNPLLILENRTVRGRRLDDDTIIRQDIGGWVAMPGEHWDEVRTILDEYARTEAGGSEGP